MDNNMLKFIKIKNSYSRPKMGELSINEKALFEYEKFCLELIKQVQNQKEVIDKVNKYLHTRGIQKCYNGIHYRGLDGLQAQVLENILKEVSE